VHWQRKIVVACGAGKFPATMRGVQPASTTRTWRELQRHFKVVAVDEHRTSSFHYWTAARLRKVYSEQKRKDVRGVLWCDLTNQPNSTPFVHRDANVAMNIRWCALSGATRPAHLCHGQPALHLRPLPRLSIPR
jgi:hypothetical protein